MVIALIPVVSTGAQIRLLHFLLSLLIPSMAHPTTSGRLADKVAIITGSSSGLGRAIALAFAANGAGRIICSDLREDARGTLGVPNADVPTHELICQQYGEKKAVFVQADMTKAEDVEGLVRSAVNVGGRLDV